MATLDATTQAEYAAEVNASARAQVVIDALADPVYGRVYDGDDRIMAEGVMTSPWAVVSGDKLIPSTLGNFFVSITDEVTGAWRLRFESGARAVSFEFGLAGSGKEAEWSLPSWELGTRAGISASEITVTGNRAPTWSGAPATLSFAQGAGGTYAFSQHAVDLDGDSLTYSLVGTAYPGISVNSSTGVLTVLGTTAVAIRDLVVRVTDPNGLYADLPVVVTIFASGQAPATIIVRTSGGTVDGLPAYTTINAAITAASAGDIIEIVAASGTSQTIAQTITITKSGAVGNPITLRVRDGHSIMLSASTSGSLLTMTGANYWIIQGNSTGRTGLVFGDATQNNTSDPEGSAASSYSHKRTATLTTCSYVGFRNLTLRGSAAYEAVRTYRDCSHIAFDNVLADYHGSVRANAAIYGTIRVGDLLWLQSRRTRITNSRISRGGHNPLNLWGSYSVLRDCELHNDWSTVFAYDGVNVTGYRCLELNPASFERFSPATATTEYGPQCIENCHLWSYKDATIGGTSSLAIQYSGRGLIIRGNVMHDFGRHAMLGPNYGLSNSGSAAAAALNYAVKVYHNTTYETKGVQDGSTYDHLNPPERNDALEKCAWINNLFHTDNGFSTKTDVFRWDAYGGVSPDGNLIPVNGWSNSWKGSRVTDNVFDGPATSMNIRLFGTGAAARAVDAADFWQESLKGSYYNVTGNTEATIPFTNTTASTAEDSTRFRTLSGFALTAGTGTAAALTTISANSTGTTITVEDPWFFKGSWGLDFADKLGAAFPNELGDYIAIGSDSGTAAIRRITGVNYSTGAVSLSAAVTATAGMGVWMASASNVWDNKGAIQ